MLEIWELITGKQQHRIGKDGGDFFRKTRPYKGCRATDDELNLNSVNQLIFVMVKCGVLFEVRTEFLNNI
jgi:hypothetical protein